MTEETATTQEKPMNFHDVMRKLEEALEYYNDTLEACSDDEAMMAEFESQIAPYLNELKGMQGEKIDAFVFIVQKARSQSEYCKKEIEAAKKRMKAIDNRIDRLKEYIKYEFAESGIQKVKGPLHTIWTTSGQSAEIEHPDMIPNKYKHKVVTEKIDSAAILETLKAGADVPGAKLKPWTAVVMRQ